MTTHADAVSATATADVLNALKVPHDRVLYVQASVDWLQRAGLAPAETLAALRAWIGDAGTLVMPSYPFHTTHLEYLESGPAFDVRRTPSTIGLLPEMFRRTREVGRSLDPDFCVSATGRDASAIIGTAPAGPDPFGADSSYQRMLDRRAVLVGLGVSLNTTSFMHAIDSRAQAGYPQPVYLDRVFEVSVLNGEGQAMTVARQALRPEFQRLTEPSAVIAAMQPDGSVFSTMEINGAIFFRWDLAPWAAWCLAHARERAATGAWPCWLHRLGDNPGSAAS